MYKIISSLGAGIRKLKMMCLGDLGQLLNVHGQFLEKIFVKVMWDRWNDAGTVAF